MRMVLPARFLKLLRVLRPLDRRIVFSVGDRGLGTGRWLDLPVPTDPRKLLLGGLFD